MISFHGMHLPGSRACTRLVGFDWARSALGDPAQWPPALHATTELCLNAAAPMLLVWGQQDIVICNDAALAVMGLEDAGAIGRPLGEACRSMADVLGPVMRRDRRHLPMQLEDRLLLIERAGRVEEAYLNLSCVPVFGSRAPADGVLCILADTTSEHLRKRRAMMLGRLSEALSKLAARDQIFPEIRKVLAASGLDFARSAMFELHSAEGVIARWSDPPDLADRLMAAGVVADLARALPVDGAHTLIRRLPERRYALCLVDESLLERRRFVMVLEPDRRVRVDADYEMLLRLLLEAIIGASYRVLIDRQAVAHMEVELTERDRLYRALFENSHDCVLICGPDGTIMAANPAACTFLDYAESELKVIGRDGIVLDDDGAITRALGTRDRDGRFVGELLFRRKDGSVVPVDVSSTLFEDAATGHGRAVVFFRDAAPRIAAQQRIATAARLQAVGELTGGIAHDFNNLLNVIINGSEILAERLAGDPVARQDADLVLSASLRAADLTRQLLAFSRQQPMHIATVDLGRVLSEMDQILARAIGGSIAVTMEVDPGLAVQADPALLQSAILNLCINARDAMPDGGPLWIGGAACAVQGALAEELSVADGAYAVVAVRDEGVGIPAENLVRVLEPFFTTKQSGKGTGLGLSSVFGFVRQSGGGMRVLSEPGRGTTVEIYLPRCAASSAAPDPTPPVPRTEAPAIAQSGNVLVVEDDDLFSSMLASILERAGYRVTAASSGDDALQILDRTDPLDLLITDILLGPGPDGWTVAAHARKVRPGLPVVTMSGFAPSAEPDRPLPPVTLTKPFRPREILGIVQRKLQAR